MVSVLNLARLLLKQQTAVLMLLLPCKRPLSRAAGGRRGNEAGKEELYRNTSAGRAIVRACVLWLCLKWQIPSQSQQRGTAAPALGCACVGVPWHVRGWGWGWAAFPHTGCGLWELQLSWPLPEPSRLHGLQRECSRTFLME